MPNNVKYNTSMCRTITDGIEFKIQRNTESIPLLWYAQIVKSPIAGRKMMETKMNSTSPNAPLPIIVKSSKSSTPILCLCKRMYSVSFFSKCFKILFCSSTGTSASCNFLSNIQRLKANQHVK